MVHGKKINEGFGRFFITKVMQHANAWNEFDIDITCVGSAVLWCKAECSSIKRIEVSTPETEERHPSLLKCTPKKSRNPDQWKRNVRKRMFQEGKEYEETRKTKKGKITKKIQEKAMKKGCDEKCRMKCTNKVSEEARKKIYDAYYSLKSITEKRNFIASRVSEVSTQRNRKRKSTNETKRRNRNVAYKYSFVSEDDSTANIAICQKMFLDTLVISKTMIKTLFATKREATGKIEEDNRGRHGKQRRICSERMKNVIDHIKTFKVIDSHYVRKSVSAQFLPAELSIREMHRLFILHCEEKNIPHENYHFYKRIFKRKFNLKFQKPKKDQCSKCTQFQNLLTPTNEEKQKNEEHLAAKIITRKLKEQKKQEAEENSNTVAAAFDLQQVLLSPHGPTGAFYYSRRLQNHNLTVTELNNMNTACYLWSEHECEKASCEVATAVLQFLTNKSSDGTKVFYLFADRCGGQNQNRNVLIMLNEAVVNLGLEKVELIFLVPGHSHNENDVAHSTIERRYRDRTIYTPSQWETTIEQSFVKNKCSVTVLTHEDIINFKEVKVFPKYKTVLSDKCKYKGKKVMWSNLVHVKFSSRDPELMYFKYDYATEFLSCSFSDQIPETRGCSISDNRQKYSKPRGIAIAKKNDLLKLCEKLLIPKQHHGYYENIPVRKEDKIKRNTGIPKLHCDSDSDSSFD